MPIPAFEPGKDGGPPFADMGAAAGLDDEAFEVIGLTVRHAAGAIDDLRDILDRLQSSVAQATEQRRNDIEIGRLFTRAQEFVEGAVIEAQELAQRIVADAEFEAARIIAAAKDEAHRLVEEGRHSTALPAEAVAALRATIGEFGRMNGALVQELSALNEAMENHRAVRQIDSVPVPPTRPSPLPGEESDEPPALADSTTPGGQTPEWGPPPWAPTGYWSKLQPNRRTSSPSSGLNGGC